mgnify:CR=1 FL=1|nr:MAG TPA: DsrH like protein [Caudoviricetes sp.]
MHVDYDIIFLDDGIMFLNKDEFANLKICSLIHEFMKDSGINLVFREECLLVKSKNISALWNLLRYISKKEIYLRII